MRKFTLQAKAKNPGKPGVSQRYRDWENCRSAVDLDTATHWLIEANHPIYWFRIKKVIP